MSSHALVHFKSISIIDSTIDTKTKHINLLEFVPQTISYFSPLFYVISDIDECELQIDNCEQHCINIQGSFKCECRPGYTKNGTKCQGKVAARFTVIINQCYDTHLSTHRY